MQLKLDQLDRAKRAKCYYPFVSSLLCFIRVLLVLCFRRGEVNGMFGYFGTVLVHSCVTLLRSSLCSHFDLPFSLFLVLSFCCRLCYRYKLDCTTWLAHWFASPDKGESFAEARGINGFRRPDAKLDKQKHITKPTCPLQESNLTLSNYCNNYDIC